MDVPCFFAAAKSRQSCPTLCDLIDGSPPGSPVPGILQARTLEWVAISSPMHESEKWKWSHSVVSNFSRPHGLQPPRSSAHGISQARVLEWVAITMLLYSFINTVRLFLLWCYKHSCKSFCVDVCFHLLWVYTYKWYNWATWKLSDSLFENC